MVAFLRALFGLRAAGSTSATAPDGTSSPGGADAWLACYRREQPQVAAAARLDTDSFEDETDPATVDQPDVEAVRKAVDRIANGRSDFLIISRGSGTDGDFLQAARDTDGQFMLEAQASVSSQPQRLHSSRMLSLGELTEAVLDYRSGGSRWTEACSWGFGPR